MINATTATRDRESARYQRHRPEQSLLYRIVEQHYPAFTDHLAARGRVLPDYVKREFDDIEIETCSACGGAVKVIACIEDPAVIQKILSHLKGKAALEPLSLLPTARAPPGFG